MEQQLRNGRTRAGGWVRPSPEGERETVGVVEREHTVVVLPRRFSVESEIRLVEAARALLIANGEREVRQLAFGLSRG
jgi:hypothetical protein